MSRPLAGTKSHGRLPQQVKDPSSATLIRPVTSVSPNHFCAERTTEGRDAADNEAKSFRHMCLAEKIRNRQVNGMIRIGAFAWVSEARTGIYHGVHESAWRARMGDMSRVICSQRLEGRKIAGRRSWAGSAAKVDELRDKKGPC